MVRPQLLICLLPLLLCGCLDDVLSLSDPIHPLPLHKMPQLRKALKVLLLASASNELASKLLNEGSDREQTAKAQSYLVRLAYTFSEINFFGFYVGRRYGF